MADRRPFNGRRLRRVQRFVLYPRGTRDRRNSRAALRYLPLRPGEQFVIELLNRQRAIDGWYEHACADTLEAAKARVDAIRADPNWDARVTGPRPHWYVAERVVLPQPSRMVVA